MDRTAAPQVCMRRAKRQSFAVGKGGASPRTQAKGRCPLEPR